LSISSDGTETELLFSVSPQVNPTHDIVLWQLSGEGFGVVDPFSVASGVALSSPSSPNVSVASNGSEVACCWDDSGSSQLTCNSVAVGGTATDQALDGGFATEGNNPALAGSAGEIAVYYQSTNGYFGQQELFSDAGAGTSYGPFDPLLAAVGTDYGYALVFGDAGSQALVIHETPGLQLDESFYVSDNTGATQAAATALGGSIVIASRQGGVFSAVLLDVDAGTSPGTVTVSSASEQTLSAIAAATCEGAVGMAYAVEVADAGLVMFREMDTGGNLIGDASVPIAWLASNPQSIGLAPGDGGLLLATSIPGQIAVYLVTCP
jgi:hypothetical protein